MKKFYITFTACFILILSFLTFSMFHYKQNIESLNKMAEEKDIESFLASDVVVSEHGGENFSPKDWTSNFEAKSFGDYNAIKGGTIKVRIPNFPSTFRAIGKGSNVRINSIMQNLIYETLLKLHPDTLDYIPSLATHWQILRDQKTFRFRINPKAKWSDGTPVTTDDVIASWILRIDPEIGSPDTNKFFLSFKQPVDRKRKSLN